MRLVLTSAEVVVVAAASVADTADNATADAAAAVVNV